MRYCLDTTAWLEYFNAGPYGPQVRDLLEEKADVVTPAVVAAELVEAARRRKTNTHTLLAFLENRSILAPVDAAVARTAGRINARRAHPSSDWGLLESLVLATAQVHKARLVTRDPLFGDVDGAFLLGSRRAIPGATPSPEEDLDEL